MVAQNPCTVQVRFRIPIGPLMGAKVTFRNLCIECSSKLVQFQLPPLCWVSSNGKSVCSEGQKILGSIPSLVICLCSSVLVERRTEDPSVAGSIPAGGTNMVLSASGQGHLVLSQVTTVRICIGLLKYGDVE